MLADVKQLTHGLPRAGDAVWAPNGRWIAFHAAVPGEAAEQLFLAPLRWDGASVTGLGRPIRVSPKGSTNAGVAFAPNGNSLIFASTGAIETGGTTAPSPNAGTATRLYRADNWEPAVAGADANAIVDLARHPISPADVTDAQPTWSPDGKWIAFASERDGNVDLYVAKPDGSGRVRVTTAAGFNGYPAFSPDGKRLLYSAARQGDRSLDLFVSQLVYDAAGNITGAKNERPITQRAAVARRATWHPDGRHVMYASPQAGQPGHRLRVVRADGTMRTDLTFGSSSDSAPVVSPDGKFVLWTARRTADGSPQVFIARLTLPEGA